MESSFHAHHQTAIQRISTKKLSYLTATLAGGSGLLMLFSANFGEYLRYNYSIDAALAGFVSLLISAVLFSLNYLQSGGQDTNNSGTSDTIELEEKINSSYAKILALEEQLQNAKVTIETYRPTIELTPDERQVALKYVTEYAGEESIQTMFNDQAKQFKEDLKRNINIERLSASSSQVVDRLRREITDLRLRSNINLLIGMSITIGGLYLLWSTVAIVDASQLLKSLASEGDESNSRFLKNLFIPIAPRILLVIFVEVFAYFFLRLYKEGLSDIKYFQNELTNIQSKIIALEFSLVSENKKSLNSSIEMLSKTERNFILQKGQTTVELERDKSAYKPLKQAIKPIKNSLKKSEERSN